uniref:RBR-type E3 ubiquitin transferase n=1 Tax=Globisporangium ultimum (strain ATCC 200006 / CBS 805.95 / DAOM BR144) TaxID=431595 RepID=K3WPW7_GLOUD
MSRRRWSHENLITRLTSFAFRPSSSSSEYFSADEASELQLLTTLTRTLSSSLFAMPTERENDPLAAVDDTIEQGRECMICFDNLDALQLQDCGLCNGSFCTTCMQSYIELKILDGEVSAAQLVCPAPECMRSLPEELIVAFASPDMIAKYKKFLKNQKTGVRFCPRVNCSAAIDEPPFCKKRKVLCTVCDAKSCTRCGGDYHRMRLCQRKEKNYRTWKRHHDVRTCPSCKSDIEKNGGCPHMTCAQCAHEFCWACLRPWKNHNAHLCKLIKKQSWSSAGQLVLDVTVGGVTVIGVIAGIGVAVAVATAAVGVTIVVVPPYKGYRLLRDSHRRKEKA